MGIDHGQFAAVAHGQVAHQQGAFGAELAAHGVSGQDRQLQALGVIDAIAAQGRQFHADAAHDVLVRDEIGFPIEGFRAARIKIDHPFLQQCQLILVVGVLGAVVDLLQQDDIGLFVADDPGYLVEVIGDVFRGGAFIFAAAVAEVVPEHVTLARQVLDVPGHDLQGLPRHQGWRLDLRRATDRQLFAAVRVPGQAVDRSKGQAEQQQRKQGIAA